MGPGLECLFLGRAAAGRPLPEAGGGSLPCPGADPCSEERSLHRTCIDQLLCDAANTETHVND